VTEVQADPFNNSAWNHRHFVVALLGGRENEEIELGGGGGTGVTLQIYTLCAKEGAAE
jgi:hypothetical protein